MADKPILFSVRILKPLFHLCRGVSRRDPYSAEADRAVGKAARGTSLWHDARDAAFYADEGYVDMSPLPKWLTGLIWLSLIIALLGGVAYLNAHNTGVLSMDTRP